MLRSTRSSVFNLERTALLETVVASPVEMVQTSNKRWKRWKPRRRPRGCDSDGYSFHEEWLYLLLGLCDFLDFFVTKFTPLERRSTHMKIWLDANKQEAIGTQTIKEYNLQFYFTWWTKFFRKISIRPKHFTSWSFEIWHPL